MIELDALCPDPDLVCSLVGKIVDPDPDQTCHHALTVFILVGKLVDPDPDLDQTCHHTHTVCSLVDKMIVRDRANPIDEVIDLRPVHLPVRDLNRKRHAFPLLLPSPDSRKLDPYSSLVVVDLAKEHSHD
jgi:hypothetical protein